MGMCKYLQEKNLLTRSSPSTVPLDTVGSTLMVEQNSAELCLLKGCLKNILFSCSQKSAFLLKGTIPETVCHSELFFSPTHPSQPHLVCLVTSGQLNMSELPAFIISLYYKTVRFLKPGKTSCSVYFPSTSHSVVHKGPCMVHEVHKEPHYILVEGSGKQKGIFLGCQTLTVGNRSF